MVGSEIENGFNVTIFVGEINDWKKFMTKEHGRGFSKQLSFSKNTFGSTVSKDDDFFNTANLYFSDIKPGYIAHESYHLLQRWFDAVNIKNPDEETVALFLGCMVQGVYSIIEDSKTID